MQPKLTQSQALALIISAIDKCITTDAAGIRDDYGCQCEAFISWYLTNLGYASVMKMNAIDFWKNNPLGLQRVSSPQPGDVHYMDLTFGGVHDGHVGVVYQVIGADVITVDENWVNANIDSGSPAAKVTHPISQMTGFYRPQFKQEEYVMDFDDSKWLYIVGIDKNYDKGEVTQADIQGNVGMKPDNAMGRMAASPQWQVRNYYATEGPGIIASLTAKIQALSNSPSQQEVQALQQEVTALQTTINALGQPHN